MIFDWKYRPPQARQFTVMTIPSIITSKTNNLSILGTRNMSLISTSTLAPSFNPLKHQGKMRGELMIKQTIEEISQQEQEGSIVKRRQRRRTVISFIGGMTAPSIFKLLIKLSILTGKAPKVYPQWSQSKSIYLLIITYKIAQHIELISTPNLNLVSLIPARDSLISPCLTVARKYLILATRYSSLPKR